MRKILITTDHYPADKTKESSPLPPMPPKKIELPEKRMEVGGDLWYQNLKEELTRDIIDAMESQSSKHEHRRTDGRLLKMVRDKWFAGYTKSRFFQLYHNPAYINMWGRIRTVTLSALELGHKGALSEEEDRFASALAEELCQVVAKHRERYNKEMREHEAD